MSAVSQLLSGFVVFLESAIRGIGICALILRELWLPPESMDRRKEILCERQEAMRMLTGLFLMLVNHRGVNVSEAAYASEALGDAIDRRRRSKRWLTHHAAIALVTNRQARSIATHAACPGKNRGKRQHRQANLSATTFLCV